MLATQPDTFVDVLLTDSNIRLSVKMFKKLTVTKILTRINLIKKCHGKLYHKLRLSVKKDTLFKTLNSVDFPFKSGGICKIQRWHIPLSWAGLAYTIGLPAPCAGTFWAKVLTEPQAKTSQTSRGSSTTKKRQHFAARYDLASYAG